MDDAAQNKTQTPMKSAQIPLTLIVAATTKNGIGKNGALPWSLKAEMKYFARVTTRLPASQHTDTHNGTQPSMKNAVIMGRKTWDSIPPKFRPLKNRVNVVISRAGNVQGLDAAQIHQKLKDEDVVLAKSLEGGLDTLSALEHIRLGRAFIIGGSSIYAEALKLEQTKHVLMTKVQGDFDCDTFFPVDLDGEDGQKVGWRRQTSEELIDFTGEDFGEDAAGVKQQEGDVEFEYRLYSR